MVTMTKARYCPHCGRRLLAGEIICNGCGHYLEFGDMVMGDEVEPNEEVRLQDMNISKFIPSASEKIVRCQLCGGENRRGSYNCQHCGFLLKEATPREEIIKEDEEVIASIPPEKHDSYRMMGIKLYIYKLIDKFSYKCQTKFQHPDGKIETCDQPLTFIHKKCPKCNEPKEIYYNCSNYDDPKVQCTQLIDMDMMVCPRCGASTLLNDLKAIITGQAHDNNAVMITRKYLQPDFPRFMMLNENYTIVITHHKLMEAKWWLQSNSKAVSEMLKMLSMFLDVMTNPKGKPSMPSIFSSFNLERAITQVQSPQPSTGLQEILQQRVADIQGVNGAAQAQPAIAAPGGGGAGGNNDDDYDNANLVI